MDKETALLMVAKDLFVKAWDAGADPLPQNFKGDKLAKVSEEYARFVAMLKKGIPTSEDPR